jgi:hypothetical protein
MIPILMHQIHIKKESWKSGKKNVTTVKELIKTKQRAMKFHIQLGYLK